MVTNVSRLSNTGVMYTAGAIDELSMNPNSLGSVTFNGTSQYLNIAANTNFSFGTGDFTIECWVQPTVAPLSTPVASTNKAIYGYRSGDDTSPYLFWNFTSGVIFGGDVTNYVTTNQPLTLNAWTHVAVARASSNLTIYINGSVIASNTVTQNFSESVNPRYVGFFNGANPYYWTGNISNLRIVKGTAVYNGGFTPPTSPLDEVSGTSLLLKTPYSITTPNDGFIDYSVNKATITTNGAPTTTAVSPFSSSGYSVDTYNSYYFTANASVASSFSLAANTTLYNNSADYTVEAWVRFETLPPVVSASTGYNILSSSSGSTSFFWLVSSDSFSIGRAGFGRDIDFVPSGGTLGTAYFQTNTWYHLAVCRSGATTRGFVNGVLCTNSGATNTAYTTGTMFVGNSYTGVTYGFKGWIYGLKFTPGTALYTSAFSSPTTAPTGGNILTCLSTVLKDNSIHNKAVTIVGGTPIPSPLIPSTIKSSTVVSKQYSNGMLQTANYVDESSINTSMIGSILFNGSSQYLNYAGTNMLLTNTGDFTIECWALFNSVSAPTIFHCMPTSTAGLGEFNIWVNNGTIRVIYDGGATFFDATSTVTTGVWYHIALVRSGSGTNNITLYINGTASGSATGTAAFGKNNTTVTIGSQNGGGSYMNGYISQVRFVRGIAVYTGNFTPPTQRLQILQNSGTNIAAITNASSTAILLNMFKSGYEDGSIYKPYNTIAAVGAPTTTTQNPFYQAAGYYSVATGTSRYLAVGYTTAFDLGSSDFTFECWVYPTSITAGNNNLLAHWGSGTTSYIFRYVAGGRPQFSANFGGTVNVTGTTTAVIVNQWNHVAITRSSTTVYLFVNGLLDATTGTVGAISSFSSPITIGAYTDGTTEYVFGNISNMRLIKNQALYTSSFTPSTTPLINTSNTILLACQSSTFIDNSTANTGGTGFTITNNGASISSLTPYVAPTLTTITANTTVRKQYANGIIQVINTFDDSTGVA